MDFDNGSYAAAGFVAVAFVSANSENGYYWFMEGVSADEGTKGKEEGRRESHLWITCVFNSLVQNRSAGVLQGSMSFTHDRLE